MKRKPLILMTMILFTLSLVLSACGDSNGTGGNDGDKKPTYRFRLAETHAPNYPTTLGDERFAELVEERSDGRIKISVFPSAQLGEEKASIEQAQLGSVDFVRTSTGPLGEFNDVFTVFSLPYLFDSDEHLWNFLEGDKGEELLTSLESSNLIGLAYYDAGARHIYSSKPVTSINDLRGLKIRVQQNRITMDMVSALGANASPMNFGEVYSSLQTGVIDAAENNYPSYYSTKHYEVAPHLILDGHQRIPEVLVVSKRTWDKLSDEDKEIIRTAARDSVEYQREKWAEYEQEARDAINEANVTVTEVEDIGVWQEAVKSVIDEHGKGHEDVLEAIDAARTTE